MTEPTVAAAVARYISDTRGKPGFVLRPGAPEQPPGTPIRSRDASDKPNAVPTPLVMHLRLPSPTPPDSVATRSGSREFVALSALAREEIARFLGPTCMSATATVPFFAREDPAVYVYVDFGAECGDGIIPFMWDRSRWVAAQYSPNRSPNEWAYTIDQIRNHELAQFSLPEDAR